MVKKTWRIAWLLVVALLLMSVSPVLAAPSTAAATTSPKLTIWKAKTTTDINKAWKIDFNVPLSSKSVNNKTIYVTDSKQKTVATTNKLSSDFRSVTVTPSKPYSAGDYNLYITNDVTSMANFKHKELIIIPFTVLDYTSGMARVDLTVTVTKDTKDPLGDISGALALETPSGARIGASQKVVDTGKYTFNLYEDGDYSLKYFYTDTDKNVFNTQSINVSKVKLPLAKQGTTVPTVTNKTIKFIIPTKDGLEARKSGAIGGQISYDRYDLPGVQKYGVPITISNAKGTWTTCTDIDGNFSIGMPTGSYQLVIDGIGPQYKKHSYKLTVAAGQMASPPETVHVKELIETLGLTLDGPVEDDGFGVLSGIDSTTTQISGRVNSDAVVEVYDTTPATHKRLAVVKPKNGEFVYKLPKKLAGMKLKMEVIDSAENVYTTTMETVVP